MIKVNTQNYLSEELKDKIFNIILFIFFSLYILKQTTFFNNQLFFNIKNINNVLFFLNLSLFFLD